MAVTEGDSKNNRRELISLAFDMGFLIAVPIVILTLAGRFADKYFNSSPLFLLIAVLLSTIVSTYSVFKKVKNLLK